MLRGIYITPINGHCPFVRTMRPIQTCCCLSWLGLLTLVWLKYSIRYLDHPLYFKWLLKITLFLIKENFAQHRNTDTKLNVLPMDLFLKVLLVFEVVKISSRSEIVLITWPITWSIVVLRIASWTNTKLFWEQRFSKLFKTTAARFLNSIIGWWF